jgi:hypothetical protein
MGRRRGGSSKKPTRTVLDKIKKCNEYLSEIRKQKTPSSTEISVLNNNLKLLENLQTAKKNDPKIYCIRPKSIIKPKRGEPSNNKQSSASNSKLSGAVIAGIVIGSVAGLLLIISLIMYFVQSNKSEN